MKILIISDSHGHIANTKHVMGFAKKIGAGAVIHCGDWDNVEAVAEVVSWGIPLYSVLGNADVDHDIEEALKFKTKGFDREFLKLEIDGRKIGIIHQVRMDDDRFKDLSILFSGHFHSKEEKMINFVKFVRPGALINGFNFAVYETITNGVEFFEHEQI